jgi:D-alanine-D-alanine ligase-like ATP-grasp enzyme
MQKLKLNTGSIDMIYTNDSKFIFLEVNPVGQFGMVSKPCNYNLEKKIALNIIT